MSIETEGADLLGLTAEIVAAHVSNNTVSVEELPTLINQVYRSLSSIGQPTELVLEKPQPAVPIKKSVFPD